MNNEILKALYDERDTILDRITEEVVNMTPNREIEKYLTECKKVQKKIREIEKALEVLKSAGVEI